MTPDEFALWREKPSESKLANSQSFLKELCERIGIDKPLSLEATRGRLPRNRDQSQQNYRETNK